MFETIRRFFVPPVFPDDEEKTRAAELLNTVLIALNLLLIVAFIALIFGGTGRFQVFVVVGVSAFVLGLLQIPMRRGNVKEVSYLTVFIFTGVLTFAIVNGGTIRAPGVALFTLSIIMGGLIIGRRAAYGMAVLTTVIFLVILWLEINGRLPEPVTTVNIQQGVIFTGNLVMAAILLGLALRRINESLERARLGEEKLSMLNIELEQRVEERTAELNESAKQIQKRASQLETIANTARSAATIQNLEKLLPAITHEISTRFGFYHVGIFLLDANKEYAILSAANSEGGQNMLAHGHRLKVGQQGIVGYVTSSGNPRIALDVGDDAVYFDNPHLPETHSEVALPLKFGQELIGALDIQSTESNAFSQEDVKIFSVLADQVSVAIQNTISLEQAQRAIQKLEIASRQTTIQAWKGFIETVHTKGYRYDGIKPEPLKESSRAKMDKETLSVPVQLRGETIGRLKLRPVDQSRKWTEDELAIIESTAERVAIALESARLLEDAQKRASRETFLSGMAAKLSSSYKLDSILRDTVEELGQTLQGSKVSFQLVDPSAPPMSDSDNDNGASGTRKGRNNRDNE
jgi:GAF domain-containing protein